MIEKYEKLYGLYEDTATLVEMGMEEEDESLLPEIKEQYDRLEQELEAQKLATLLSGEYDANNAILTFHISRSCF